MQVAQGQGLAKACALVQAAIDCYILLLLVPRMVLTLALQLALVVFFLYPLVHLLMCTHAHEHCVVPASWVRVQPLEVHVTALYTIVLIAMCVVCMCVWYLDATGECRIFHCANWWVACICSITFDWKTDSFWGPSNWPFQIARVGALIALNTTILRVTLPLERLPESHMT